MNKKIIIAAAVILIVLGFLPFLRHGPDSLEEALNHLKQERPVAYYFERERNLKIEQDEEYRIFRLQEEG